jgi:hypothetical protein
MADHHRKSAADKVITHKISLLYIDMPPETGGRGSPDHHSTISAGTQGGPGPPQIDTDLHKATKSYKITDIMSANGGFCRAIVMKSS